MNKEQRTNNFRGQYHMQNFAIPVTSNTKKTNAVVNEEGNHDSSLSVFVYV